MLHFPFAYVGPGAGFAFLGSFFSILLSLLAGIASLLLWPFRAMLRVFRRGTRVRARVVLLGIEGVASTGWSTADFWKSLADNGVDSTALSVPGTFPDDGFKGRRVWRTAEGQTVSQPSYYSKYLVRLLGSIEDQEAMFFSALDHQQNGVLACIFDVPREFLERIARRLLETIGPGTTVIVVGGENAIVSKLGEPAEVLTTDDIAPAVLRIFGIPVVRFA